MIIPEIKSYVAPDGKTWIAVITLVTGWTYGPYGDRTPYIVWQAIDPKGEIVSWGYSKRRDWGFSAARRAIKRRWAILDYVSKEEALRSIPIQ